MMIALTRNVAQEDAAMRAGGWQHTIGPGLSGKTLGVVGLGRLGVPVATLAQALGMRVIAWSPNLTRQRAAEHGVRAVSKAELFQAADVVTVHMPLSDRSRGLIGSAELEAMKPTAYLVNTSRGPIVTNRPWSTHSAPDESQAIRPCLCTWWPRLVLLLKAECDIWGLGGEGSGEGEFGLLRRRGVRAYVILLAASARRGGCPRLPRALSLHNVKMAWLAQSAR